VGQAEDLLRRLRESLTPDTFGRMNTVMGLEVEGLGAFTLDCRAGKGQGLLEGLPQANGLEPRFGMVTTRQDLEAMMAGDLNAIEAMMNGRLKMSGDLGYAMRLAALFE
jgi:hypothetical protein